MNCVIERNNLKVFGKAIHALSRIGAELWLDPMDRGLALRSVSATHSAYGCFLFSPCFFQQYSLGSEAIKCKLSMKAVLPLFRCPTSIERGVDRCHISVSIATDRVIFQFFCRHGITKTHNMHFQESEALHAVFASHLCPNVLKARARLLADVVTHFPQFQEEITLSITPLKVTIKSYQQGDNGPGKTTYTEMSLHPNEFDHFHVGLDTDITFCLKELRGLLLFAESNSLPVSLYLDAAGKPVCFSVEDTVLEAFVLLATLVDSESREHARPTEPPTPKPPRCAGFSARPVDMFEGAGRMEQDVPDLLVQSSQGSPIFPSPELNHLQPTCLSGASRECVSTSPKVLCSLLFQALSSEQHDDDDDDDGGGGCAAQLPVLACHSDEESTADNHPGRREII